jgi:hypothetical protein
MEGGVGGGGDKSELAMWPHVWILKKIKTEKENINILN